MFHSAQPYSTKKNYISLYIKPNAVQCWRITAELHRCYMRYTFVFIISLCSFVLMSDGRLQSDILWCLLWSVKKTLRYYTWGFKYLWSMWSRYHYRDCKCINKSLKGKQKAININSIDKIKIKHWNNLEYNS